MTGSVETALDRLAQRKDDWVRVDISDRLDILRRCSEGLLAVGADWVELACAAKGIDAASALAGEEWISGPMVTMRSLRLIRRALEEGGQRRPPRISRRDGGQLVAEVMPADLFDRLLFPGVRAEVWIEPDKPASQGKIYREKMGGQYSSGRVALVLGAGNVGSIAPTDVLHKLFVEDQVVILKMNPVNDYLGPLIESAFESLIDPGFLAVAYGGADVGSALCRDERVGTIHLTGSDRTHDAIVWGSTQKERVRRRRDGRPLLDKPFSSELGCVTPVLVVPGSWKSSDLDFQARHVAAMVAHNASFNCTAAKVLVLARDWDLADAFRDRVEARLSSVPQRYPYYPGARERYRALLSHYPNARPLGEPGTTGVPWTIIPDVPAGAGGEHALTSEAFCGVLAVTELEARGPAEFLERAVDFVNDEVWGTLACSILIDPRTARRHNGELDRAVADLRYGGIGINVWAGVNFGVGSTSWGAFPGHTPESIGSGRGTVHNAFLFDHPEKSVVRAPFRQFPKPVMFTDHRTLDELGRKLTSFEAAPSLTRLPGILRSALRG